MRWDIARRAQRLGTAGNRDVDSVQQEGLLTRQLMVTCVIWLADSPKCLLRASELVHVTEGRPNPKVGYPRGNRFYEGYIDADAVVALACSLAEKNYGGHLVGVGAHN